MNYEVSENVLETMIKAEIVFSYELRQDSRNCDRCHYLLKCETY